MSKQVFTKVIRGAHAVGAPGRRGIAPGASAEHGPEKPVGWGPQTSYYLPMSYALMGLEAKTLGDLRPQVEHARELLGPVPVRRDVAALPGRRAGRGGGVDAGHGSPGGAADRQRLRDAARLARLHLRHDHARVGHPTGRRAHAGVRPDPRPGADHRDRRADRARAAEAQHPDFPLRQPRRATPPASR